METTELIVNGKSRKLEADSRVTLLDALRNHLGLIMGNVEPVR